MANMTERNGLVFSCEPSLNARTHFHFFFLQFEFVLFCSVFFLLIFQGDTSLFLFHLIVENLMLHTFLIIMIIIPCSGMFHVPRFIDGPKPGRETGIAFHIYVRYISRRRNTSTSLCC